MSDVTLEGTDLESRVREFEYHPEIYIYPTPRMYDPLPNFSLEGLSYSDELNVYVHVPFCTHFCSFCGYFKTIYNEQLQSDFVQAVCREIELRADSLKGKTVKTLHFGGGTPSLLTPSQLETIVATLRRANPGILDSCEEVSMEATPESIDREKFAGYRQVGINRVSMGVQSLVDAEVKMANRCLEKERTSFEMLAEAFDSLRGVGFEDLVIDLMIGIEGQTQASFEESVSKALSLRPQTVQLYALGVMPQTAIGRRKPQELLTGRQIYDCYVLGRDMFRAAGYRQDSHDRYTLHPVNGFLQGDFNIQGMSLIGLGAGARSYAKGVHFRNIYTSQNGRKALIEYMERVQQGRHAVESGVYLSLDEQARQYAIGHIRHLDCERFLELFGERFEDKFSLLYSDLLRLELAKREGAFLPLTDQGLLFRDLIARQLFSAEANARELAYRP